MWCIIGKIFDLGGVNMKNQIIKFGHKLLVSSGNNKLSLAPICQENKIEVLHQENIIEEMNSMLKENKSQLEQEKKGRRTSLWSFLASFLGVASLLCVGILFGPATIFSFLTIQVLTILEALLSLTSLFDVVVSQLSIARLTKKTSILEKCLNQEKEKAETLKTSPDKTSSWENIPEQKLITVTDKEFLISLREFLKSATSEEQIHEFLQELSSNRMKEIESYGQKSKSI